MEYCAAGHQQAIGTAQPVKFFSQPLNFRRSDPECQREQFGIVARSTFAHNSLAKARHRQRSPMRERSRRPSLIEPALDFVRLQGFLTGQERFQNHH